jgi:integrase
MKLKLTSAFCKEVTCPPGKRKEVYRCTEQTGFGIEVRASGKKTYWHYYTNASGKAAQIKIGGYADIPFEAAKRKAKELRSHVVLGGDPTADKAERKAIPLYNDLADQHLAYGRTYLRRPEDIDSILRNHIRPRWGKVRVNDIKSQDIAQWLAEKRKSGLSFASCEKIRVTLHKSFELAIKWDIPGVDRNPVHAVPRPKYNNKKELYITADQATRLIAACEQSPNTQLKAIVQLLLLTGARKMELLKARWENVDLARKSWHIPDSKTGKPRYVPLSQAAIDVIEGLPRFDNCPWLIPNPETREPYVDIKRPWTTARNAAGLPDLRIHDLRHSAASFMINAGINLYAVGSILGHADYQSTQRYSHLANDTLLAAVEAGAAGWTQSTSKELS